METKITQAEVEKLVLDLHKQGLGPEKIGLVLRDSHGIPKAKLYGKRINQILKKNKIEINPDITNLELRIEKLKKHTVKNKQDKKTKRALIIKEAKLLKLKNLSK